MKTSIKARIINYYRKMKARGPPRYRIFGIPIRDKDRKDPYYRKYGEKPSPREISKLKSLNNFISRLKDDSKYINNINICSGCGVKLENTTYCSFCGMDIREYLIDFRGSKIPQYEADVLMKLEEDLDDKFYVVKKIDERMKIGFCEKENHVNSICITYTDLELIPDTIENLQNLEILILEWNHIKNIPNSIGNLKSLRSLRLNNNIINTIPNSIFNLNNLEELFICINPIDEETKNKIKILKEKGIYII